MRNSSRKTKPHSFIRAMYYAQCQRSKKWGYDPPEYSFSELKSWLLDQDLFHKLYREWQESGHKRAMAPSCDRLDDYKGYSFDNIQLVRFDENRKKGWLDQLTGKNTKRAKAVEAVDPESGAVKRFHSTTHAERETGAYHSHVSRACGTDKIVKGLIWRYA